VKFNKKKIAFFDRDGVLNISNINDGYIGFKKDFKWVTGAKKALKYIQNLGYKIIIVTNQSGVARGYFSIKDVNILHKYMRASLKKIDVRISGIFFCPFHIDGVVSKYKKKSNLRKPNNGMFLKVKKKMKIDIENSFMIGDQKTDMEFAKKSKIKGYLFKEKNLYKFLIKKISK
jgi:D-glycero-D-manno-heptose 1,7-bisphosphate phosphatase